MTQEEYVQALNKAFLIGVIKEKLNSASMEKLVEIGKILKL